MGFNHSKPQKSKQKRALVKPQRPIANAQFSKLSSIHVKDSGDPLDTIDSEKENIEEQGVNFSEYFLADSYVRWCSTTNRNSKNGILKNGENKTLRGFINEEAKVVRFSVSKSAPHSQKRIKVKKQKRKQMDTKYQKPKYQI